MTRYEIKTRWVAALNDRQKALVLSSVCEFLSCFAGIEGPELDRAISKALRSRVCDVEDSVTNYGALINALVALS